jgi:hypothetical protein
MESILVPEAHGKPKIVTRATPAVVDAFLAATLDGGARK